MVSQNKIPGSADFQALCTIFFHKPLASIRFVNLGFSLKMGYFWIYSEPSLTAFINASSIRTDTLAPVTLPCSNLASIKSSESGWLMDTESIKAPRLPSCATSRVEFEYRSINGTIPVEVNAEFLTSEPFGRICDKSWPTPPRRFMSCTCSWSIFIMPPYESDSPELPITKQLESEAIW